MNVLAMVKLAAGAALGLGLAGCVDANVDIAITSPTTARVTMTQKMGAEFYAMVKTSTQSGEASGEDFCAEGKLTENSDGSAVCVIVEDGAFDTLSLAGEPDGLHIASAGNGLVRVSMPTAQLKSELGAGEGMDEETKQMVEAVFAGRNVTIVVSGAEVVDTNMNRSDDGRSAETVIPLLDLINGTLDIPDDLFAVVRAP